MSDNDLMEEQPEIHVHVPVHDCKRAVAFLSINKLTESTLTLPQSLSDEKIPL